MFTVSLRYSSEGSRMVRKRIFQHVRPAKVPISLRECMYAQTDQTLCIPYEEIFHTNRNAANLNGALVRRYVLYRLAS